MNEIKSIRIITGVQERSILTRTLTYESLVYMETIEQGFSRDGFLWNWGSLY